MADKYVPMISSGVAGPLGVLHLPRLWLKVSLEEQGKLAPGYPGIGRGFDAMTCAALGLEEQAVKDFIKQNKPRNPQSGAGGRKKGNHPPRGGAGKATAGGGGNFQDAERGRRVGAWGVFRSDAA